jgi:hypothetical protein
MHRKKSFLLYTPRKDGNITALPRPGREEYFLNLWYEINPK